MKMSKGASTLKLVGTVTGLNSWINGRIPNMKSICGVGLRIAAPKLQLVHSFEAMVTQAPPQAESGGP